MVHVGSMASQDSLVIFVCLRFLLWSPGGVQASFLTWLTVPRYSSCSLLDNMRRRVNPHLWIFACCCGGILSVLTLGSCFQFTRSILLRYKATVGEHSRSLLLFCPCGSYSGVHTEIVVCRYLVLYLWVVWYGQYEQYLG